MSDTDITPKQALDALSDAMRRDPDYAWGWHCNLAMLAVDAGAPRREANERAAGFMWSMFGVPTQNMIKERTSFDCIDESGEVSETAWNNLGHNA